VSAGPTVFVRRAARSWWPADKGEGVWDVLERYEPAMAALLTRASRLGVQMVSWTRECGMDGEGVLCTGRV
jgi:hypothetical protein